MQECRTENQPGSYWTPFFSRLTKQLHNQLQRVKVANFFLSLYKAKMTKFLSLVSKKKKLYIVVVTWRDVCLCDVFMKCKTCRGTLLCFPVVSIVPKVKYHFRLWRVSWSEFMFVYEWVCLKQKQVDFHVLLLILVRWFKVRRREDRSEKEISVSVLMPF